MEFNRTQNAARNIFFGMVLKVYQLIVPFVMRTVMLYYLGIQYLGLNSLFTSVLQVLNLAELGVGSAMVYSMYKPIVENNRAQIRSLMRLYRTYYRIIGLVILVSGTILTPFIPHLIHGSVPSDMNIYILYLLNLAATVLSYWLFAYKNSILNAYQRVDVVSKVTLFTNTVMYAFQIWMVVEFKNYYAYIIVTLAGQVLTNILTAIAANKLYPDLNPGAPLDKEEVKIINRRIRDLMTSRLGSVAMTTSDTIIISSFLGLTILAQYQNYFYIVTAAAGILGIVFNSVTAGIGNSLIVETKEKNVQDLAKFTFIISWVSGVGAACMLTLFQPFMELWVGRKNLLSFGVVVCMAIYFFVTEVNQLLNTYKDAGGIWHKDRYRTLVVSMINICLNLLMTPFFGVYGAMLSTVLAILCVGMPWIFYNLFTTIFEKRHLEEYLKKVILYVFVTIIGCVFSVAICSFIKTSLVLSLIINLIISVVIMDILYFVVYRGQYEFSETIKLVDKLTKHKIPLLKKFI
ncbi:oligosaccharide flippase family protein [Ligilactobacillus equi]|uniref:polysaccharide biosynthesis protein n=1 Tax=Ligilactobacillus equi TaxID=137357 RepID=UPI002ED5D91B